MIYLDHGATSFPKPRQVRRAMARAVKTCGNPGRGGYAAAMEAGRIIYDCREAAAALFHCSPEQVVFTGSCTQGLNMAIHALFRPGDQVAITGFEHNAVTRSLWGRNLKPIIGGRKLFDWEDSLKNWEKALDQGAVGAVFTHVSNVFGYILPVEEMAAMCKSRGLPFILDAAQSAGRMDVDFWELGADYIAMPGHKGLLGPEGTGILLCKEPGRPLLFGGTGTNSKEQEMPEFLPERLEPGTPNVPGIAGLRAGIRLVTQLGPEKIGRKEEKLARYAGEALQKMGFQVFLGPHQAGTFSFLPGQDPEEAAALLGRRKIALRAGLHCAPLAHESAGTEMTGTLRVSFGKDSDFPKTEAFLKAVSKELL